MFAKQTLPFMSFAPGTFIEDTSYFKILLWCERMISIKIFIKHLYGLIVACCLHVIFFSTKHLYKNNYLY